MAGGPRALAALDNIYMRRVKTKVYVCQDMVTAIP
jgi:hypothetical protein